MVSRFPISDFRSPISDLRFSPEPHPHPGVAKHDLVGGLEADAARAAGNREAPSLPDDASPFRSAGELGREERECPFCAERILVRAKVCKHCGRDVSAAAAP